MEHKIIDKSDAPWDAQCVTTGASMSRPTLDAALSTLHDRLGPLAYQAYDALPDELAERQAALLQLAEQPYGGLAGVRHRQGAPRHRDVTLSRAGARG